MLGDRAVAGERSVMAFSAQAGGFVEQPYMSFARGGNRGGLPGRAAFYGRHAPRTYEAGTGLLMVGLQL